MDPSVTEGIVGSDGSITISGEPADDLPEGDIVLTVPGYGYTIDNTISLMRGDHTVMISLELEEDKEEPQTD
ncbi:MAG: hypothetical protein R6U70_04260 [Bacillota bacterium]